MKINGIKSGVLATALGLTGCGSSNNIKANQEYVLNHAPIEVYNNTDRQTSHFNKIRNAEIWQHAADSIQADSARQAETNSLLKMAGCNTEEQEALRAEGVKINNWRVTDSLAIAKKHITKATRKLAKIK